MDVIQMIFQYMKAKLLGEDYINQKYILESTKVLHITDTPKGSFNYIEKLIKKFNPEYIIHTGDLVDDIKLELYPYKINEYKKEVRHIIQLLENSNAKEIYITLGNHDHYETIRSLSSTIKIIKTYDVVTIGTKKFFITHDGTDVVNNLEIDYILHGHNFLTTYAYSFEKYFNGLNYIYIFYPKLNKFVKLKYPFGTTDQRLQKSKLGI